MGFASEYLNKEKPEFADKSEFINNFIITNKILTEFSQYLRRENFEFESADFQKDKEFISLLLKGEIGRLLYSMAVYYEVLRHADRQIIESLSQFSEIDRLIKSDNVN